MLAARPAPGLAPRQAGWPKAIGAVTRWRDAARVGLDAAFAAAQGAQAGTRAVKENVAQRAGAVGDAAAQIAHVPADVAREVRKELEAWSSGVAKTLAGAAMVGVLGLFALVIVSVGAVVLLNRTLGDPYGTLAVGAVYLLAALLGVVWMVRSKRAAAREVELHGEHARDAVSLDPPAEVVAERGT